MLEPGARALAPARGLGAVLAAALGEAELESRSCGVLLLRGCLSSRRLGWWLLGLSWAEALVPLLLGLRCLLRGLCWACLRSCLG